MLITVNSTVPGSVIQGTVNRIIIKSNICLCCCIHYRVLCNWFVCKLKLQLGLVLNAYNISLVTSTVTLRLTVPFTRTEPTKHAFRCSAPSVWNSLPSFITNTGSLTTFKSQRLKFYVFCVAFDFSVHVWPGPTSASVSEVTTLRRFINQFIIIIINML